MTAAAMMIVMMAGCGGSGHHLVPTTTVPVSGGVTPATGTVTTPVAASDTPQTITVNIGGTPTTAILPAGLTVAAGQSVAVITPASIFISNLTVGAAGSRAPGDVTLNNEPTGLHIVDGHLDQALALPAGTFTLSGEGPFSVQNGAAILTMQTVSFVFSSDGVQTSLPTALQGTVPANGSNNATNSVTTSFSSNYQSGTARLTITHTNGTLDQTVNLSSGSATFHDFNADQQSQIPVSGVNTVTFTHL